MGILESTSKENRAIMRRALPSGVWARMIKLSLSGEVEHDALPNAFKKYDETTLQLCITRPPSGVGHAAKISRKKSNSKLFDLKKNAKIG